MYTLQSIIWWIERLIKRLEQMKRLTGTRGVCEVSRTSPEIFWLGFVCIELWCLHSSYRTEHEKPNKDGIYLLMHIFDYVVAGQESLPLKWMIESWKSPKAEIARSMEVVLDTGSGGGGYSQASMTLIPGASIKLTILSEWLEVPCFFTSLTFISWDSFCFVRCNSGNLLLKNSGSIAKKFKRPYKSSGYFMFRSIFMCTYESYQKFKNPGKRTINFDLLAIIFTSDMYEMKAPSPIPTQNISSVLVL